MGVILLQLIKLLVIDVVFLAFLAVLLVPLAMYKKASFAVLKRNVIGYFSNPTGYVFLCVFVFLTSIAAFWPDSFFISNLANLDQLSTYMPLILLLFIPAISMSIWSEERRQGTDELLLTLPATDFDIVLGKYLAAAAIFTLSLLFSQVAGYAVLTFLSLGDLDVGLVFTTYIGYWLMGLAMLAIGMVASFLTNNATVSFVLGMLFNIPLVGLAYVDRILAAPAVANQVMQWSLASRFDDFGRGVISLSSTLFFLSIILLGVYVSIIMIGRRHWSGRGKDQAQTENQLTTTITGVALGLLVIGLLCFLGTSLSSHPRVLLALQWTGGSFVVLALLAINASAILNAMQGGMLGHFMLRVECLIIAGLGLCFYLSRHEVLRQDLTAGRVSSLSPDTIKLINDLDPKRPVVIDAFISADLPKEFIKTRYNLLSSLKELRQHSGGRIQVNLHDNLELFSEEAALAETRYGIRKQTFQSMDRQKVSQAELIIGAAFNCGLEKVVVPFFGHGLPVEYELVRSVATVAKGSRKKLGVVTTDAQMYGGFSMQGMSPRQIPKQALIDELEKQYRVEQVDPANTIEVGKYDALLVVQPSSLGPQELSNLVEAVKAGQPCAIFEDPMPSIFAQGSVPGTAAEKQAPGGFMGMGGGPPPPKGDIKALWDVLGIKTLGEAGPLSPVPAQVVWQDYNPYPRFQRGLGPELVFIREDAPGAKNVFNAKTPVVSDLEELLFLFPGGVESAIGAKTTYTPLVATATGQTKTGSVEFNKLRMAQGNRQQLKKEYDASETNRRYDLAAEIRGPEPEGSAAKSEDKKDDSKKTEKDGDKKEEEKKDEPAKPRGIHCIYVADIDMLDGIFLSMRAMPNPDYNFRFDNVVFVLNVIDQVAGDDRFLRIRSRKPQHSTLRLIEDEIARTRERESVQLKEYQAKFDKQVAEIEETSKKRRDEFAKQVDELKKKQDEEGQLDPSLILEFQEKQRQQRLIETIEQQRVEVEKKRLEQDLERDAAKERREGDRKIESIQNSIKLAATALPLIFPLLIGLTVFAQRRVREREGVSKARLRY
jgi:ABC-2 type transport system permease protein